MESFLDAAEAISRLSDAALRADAAGCFQALMGLWQILDRRGLNQLLHRYVLPRAESQ